MAAQPRIEHRSADQLRKGYSKAVRRFEIFCIVAYWALLGVIAWKLAPHAAATWPLLVISVFTGYVLADFVSGFFHWAGDTWGSPELPLLGPGVVRPFREHHVDQKAITRHDYIETNGMNCMISLMGESWALMVPINPEHPGWGVFFSASFAWMIFWVMMTNQFHKWAHEDREKLPGYIVWLQDHHVILNPVHHEIHHAPPYAKYYCITAGWLNWPLYKIKFFPTLERIITAVTGMIPRKDDIGLYAALHAAQAAANEEAAASAKLQVDLPST